MVYVHTMETPADAIDKGKMRINVYDKQQGIPLADARISGIIFIVLIESCYFRSLCICHTYHTKAENCH